VRPRVLPELLQVLPLFQAEHEMHEPCAVPSYAVRRLMASLRKIF